MQIPKPSSLNTTDFDDDSDQDQNNSMKFDEQLVKR